MSPFGLQQLVPHWVRLSQKLHALALLHIACTSQDNQTLSLFKETLQQLHSFPYMPDLTGRVLQDLDAASIANNLHESSSKKRRTCAGSAAALSGAPDSLCATNP